MLEWGCLDARKRVLVKVKKTWDDLNCRCVGVHEHKITAVSWSNILVEELT